MDKNNNNGINVDETRDDEDGENTGLNASQAKKDHLALDNNISAYRQSKQGSV